MKDLADEINRALKEYTTEVEEGLEESKKEVAKMGVKILKRESPELTGDYRKGWRVKKVGTSYVIHNKTDYQLTHLLEHGHAKRGGGRVQGIPHIRPTEQKVIDEFTRQVERAIRA